MTDPAPPAPPIHPDVAPLTILLGRWSGAGEGSYPTIEPFGYTEQIELTHNGKPFLAYSQKTRDRGDGRPLHAETGYWRYTPDGIVELVLAHPTGVLELLVGTIATEGDAVVIDLATTHVSLSPSAKEVTALTRRFVVRGDELRYDLAMAAVGQPLTHHLSATLHRTA